jgi:hypothetical protein
MLGVIMVSAITQGVAYVDYSNKANYSECSNIKCCYPVCYYAECRGAILMDSSTILLRLINILKKKTLVRKQSRSNVI